MVLKLFVVLLISETLVKPISVATCHLITEPVLPIKVSVALFTLAQTATAPEIDPPTERLLTIAVPVAIVLLTAFVAEN